MDFDFSKIRPYQNSQNSGFEELVCQLAHLQKPNNAVSFVRKEGAGGDAGVECFWILKNGTEHCWQAKFFTREMSKSSWDQLDKSFDTALEKHGGLKKYTVCLPLDRTDSRKIGRGGKKVISVLDEWNEYVKKWKEIAKEKGRDIEFEYWGKHEIVSFLMIDDPLYTGRALYWFNKPVICFERFKKIVLDSKESLDERYTPEFHVELPIAKKFDGLSLNPSWWKDLSSRLKELKKQRERFFREFVGNNPNFLDSDNLKTLEALSKKLVDLIENGVRNRYFLSTINKIRKLCDEVQVFQEVFLKTCGDSLYEEENLTQRSDFNSFFAEFREFYSFLHSDAVKASEKKAALLSGEAGIGKSHLLCDLSLHRIDQGLPTVFLLGQHYSGADPLNFITEALDLQNCRHQDVLGALDAAGEAHKTQTLIVIDAINEGSHRDDWRNYLKKFLSELSRYKNISILLSCRTTYLKYLIPEDTFSNDLVEFKHFGFQGYEHRAAAKYLSKQGIVRPSAPILAPEFTNPLFLKTCCRALKNNNMTTFPKGLQGFSRLFTFYIESMEKVIAHRRKYNVSEEAVKNALISFAKSLFPDNLDGISYSEARKIINNFDPQPHRDDSLFDELLYESILSEDISYKDTSDGRRGTPVIRFTYERFSDYFIAKQIVEKYTSENIQEIFYKDQPLGKTLFNGLYYRLEGIIEVLSILIAEKFKLELIDILPKEIGTEEWVINDIFAETIIWRSPESITDRTLELLNSLRGLGDDSPAIDILLKLSTEPNHPWNAEFLHNNLLKRPLAERDYFWSIHLALSDQSEEDSETESIVRTIIDWACFGNLDDVEEERFALCTITLWFLTTPNRRVRDQATKSLVRLIHIKPDLLVGLLKVFHNVDDLYLVERLYAVAYGVICNIDDKEVISDIAKTVFKLVFADGSPTPHILLRDYARGILEYALYKGLLSDKINPDSFRPPYKSKWPIENPSKEDINKLEGDKFSSAIKSSLMGFPGDFGNYIMSCVHDWSPTPLSSSKPETGRELKLKFAKNLSGELRQRYLNTIKPLKKLSSGLEKIDIKIILAQLSDNKKNEVFNAAEEEWKNLKKNIEETLNSEQKEYFRWLSGLSDDRPAAFSRKWAQRWVCMRAHQLGWREDLFGNFEKRCSHGRESRMSSHMERMGKKYQWIALHEFLAYLSDNVHWIGREYSDLDNNKYFGPWQIHERNIDPTIWIRKKSGKKESYYNEKATWWQSYKFPFKDLNDLSQQLDFLWSESIVPDFSKILQVTGGKQNFNWTVLCGFWNERQRDNTDDTMPTLDAWFRINSIIIKNSDFEKLKKKVVNKNLCDPHHVNVNSTQHEGFLGEYPWHLYYQNMTDWYDPRDLIPVKYLVPVSKYEWESGSFDFSVQQSLSFYLPSQTLIQDLSLSRSKESVGIWNDKQQKAVFMDPSVNEEGPSYALITTEMMQDWLKKNNMKLVWLIGGEKSLFTTSAQKFHGCLVYSGLYTIENEKPVGELWFQKEPGRDID